MWPAVLHHWLLLCYIYKTGLCQLPGDPKNFSCDACTSVAYEMTNALKRAEKFARGQKLQKPDYTFAFEAICDSRTYEFYGVKDVNGVMRLSGPALETANAPGELQGGGKWPERLSEKCLAFVKKVGKRELYDAFHELQDVQDLLCKTVSDDCKAQDDIDFQEGNRLDDIHGSHVREDGEL